MQLVLERQVEPTGLDEVVKEAPDISQTRSPFGRLVIAAAHLTDSQFVPSDVLRHNGVARIGHLLDLITYGSRRQEAVIHSAYRETPNEIIINQLREPLRPSKDPKKNQYELVTSFGYTLDIGSTQGDKREVTLTLIGVYKPKQTEIRPRLVRRSLLVPQSLLGVDQEETYKAWQGLEFDSSIEGFTPRRRTNSIEAAYTNRLGINTEAKERYDMITLDSANIVIDLGLDHTTFP